eukprot:6188967-Pleurochrysis_carterae.AAC.2
MAASDLAEGRLGQCSWPSVACMQSSAKVNLTFSTMASMFEASAAMACTSWIACSTSSPMAASSAASQEGAVAAGGAMLGLG